MEFHKDNHKTELTQDLPKIEDNKNNNTVKIEENLKMLKNNIIQKQPNKDKLADQLINKNKELNNNNKLLKLLSNLLNKI